MTSIVGIVLISTSFGIAIFWPTTAGENRRLSFKSPFDTSPADIYFTRMNIISSRWQPVLRLTGVFFYLLVAQQKIISRKKISFRRAVWI